MLVAQSATGRRKLTLRALGIGERGAPRLDAVLGERGFPVVFRSSVEEGLEEVLGACGAKAILYHLDLPNFYDPEEFQEKLSSIFGVGAASLERAILQQLNRRVHLRQPTSEEDGFVDQVERARGAFEVARRSKEH